MNQTCLRQLWTIGTVVLVTGMGASIIRAQPDSQDGLTYKTGFSVIRGLGVDLYKVLDDKFKPMVHSQPIWLETTMMPSIKLVEYDDEPKPMRGVFISAGFIDLMNNVAHAKAIDRIEKGYFEKYVLTLAEETGEKELRELPNLRNKKYWSDAVLNDQVSHFNQMVSMVVAIKLAHHYLGHYQKYKGQLVGAQDKTIAINNLLTSEEWGNALKAGAHNALSAGLGTDGLKDLYDGINKMPQRPAWTTYFLPKDVKVDKVKKDLEKWEKKFYAGESF